MGSTGFLTLRGRESFKKFRKTMLAIDVDKRARELDNTPFSKFLEGYAPEIEQGLTLTVIESARAQR